MNHPLYDSDPLVARVTDEHIAAGRTVFQLFQLHEDEGLHSLYVLDLVDLPPGADVLSLGCGVGGMEAYWQQRRPDLRFTLVNRSQAQLDRCRCPGRKVFSLLEVFRTRRKFDCTVLAYVLGHVNIVRALEVALRCTKPGGKIVVLDVFDGTRAFEQAMAYWTPVSRYLTGRGFREVEADWYLNPWVGVEVPWVRDHATPGMYVYKVPHE